MSQAKNSAQTSLTPGEITFAAIMGGGLLTMSIAQASSELWAWGSNPIERFYLMGLVVFSLLSSQFLIRAAILNWKNTNTIIAVICILVVCGIETFSYKTTKLAIQGRAAETVQAENKGSDEYKTALRNEKRYERQLAALEQSYIDTPADHSTARKRIADDITTKTNELLKAQLATGSVNVSITGANIGSSFSVLVAILQTLIPIVINLACMMITAARQGKASKVVTGKKPQGRARLKVV